MKKVITLLTLLMLISSVGLLAVACDDGEYNVTEAEGVPNVLQDYEVAPEVSVAESVHTAILPIINDSSLSTAEKIQQIMNAVEYNESFVNRYTYFNYTKGTTKIEDKSGTLIYQRLRKQNSDSKDDTTLKLPVNHNFGATEVAFVRSAALRYNPAGNTYYRMQADGDKIKYDEKSGLLSVDNADWKKHSQFGSSGTISPGIHNLEDAKKTCANWNCEGIVAADSAKIEKKTTDNGDVYYELTFEIDKDVANADETTISRLEQDNSGVNMSVNYIKATVQVWECGLLKYYTTDESWNGKIGKGLNETIGLWYEGSAQSVSNVFYSYSERDNDMSNSESIKNGLL